MNLPEMLMLKYPDAKLGKDIILADEGQGPFIRHWNLDGVAQPSPEEIEQYKLDLQSQYDAMVVQQNRQAAYNANGADINALIVALWEKVMENRTDSADAVQAKRAQIKQQFPKS